MDEITRIGSNTEFNGINLLDGSAGTLSRHVGIGNTSASNIHLDLGDSFTAAGLNLSTLNIIDEPSGPAAQPVFDRLNGALQTLSAGRAALGAMQNRLESTIRVNMNYQENLSAANSRIRDVDIALETSALTSAQILQQVAISILSQANTGPNLALRLLGM